MHIKQKTAYKILTSQGLFENFNVCIVKYTSMCLYIIVYLNIIPNNNVLKNKSAYKYAN